MENKLKFGVGRCYPAKACGCRIGIFEVNSRTRICALAADTKVETALGWVKRLNAAKDDNALRSTVEELMRSHVTEG